MADQSTVSVMGGREDGGRREGGRDKFIFLQHCVYLGSDAKQLITGQARDR